MKAASKYLDKFHDEVDVAACLVFLVETHNVDVVASLHYCYLVLNHVHLHTHHFNKQTF